jgi:very-short-patch-repair endonuclease
MNGDILLSLYSLGDKTDILQNGKYGQVEEIFGAVSKIRNYRRHEWNDDDDERQLNYAIIDAVKRGESLSNTAIDNIKEAISICESPIEKCLLPWIATQRYQFFNYPPVICKPDCLHNIPPFAIAITPQLQIGRFRIDFCILARLNGASKALLIECDGKEYHQDQARDKWRSSLLMRNDKIIGIHRVTGYEIFKDVQLAAAGISKTVIDAWSKVRA